MSTVSLDYLVIGHVACDMIEGGHLIGGTASYSSRTARALGCRTGLVTSAGLDLDLSEALDGVVVANHPAAASTTFRNTYVNGISTREQRVLDLATRLVPAMVPAGWEPSLVHVGPIAQECAPELALTFGSAFIGLTPQGWMREWDTTGRVRPCEWPAPEPLLERADAVVLSEMDVSGLAAVERYAGQTRVLVVTTGAAGCVVYVDGDRQDFPAHTAREVDPTGAGDIFAAVFFTWLHKTGDLAAAARFANCIAARSVTRVGLASTPTRHEVARCRDLVTPRRTD